MAAGSASQLKDVFISYGREPGVIQFVQQLKRDLEMKGFSLWLDMEDIKSGTDWRAEIGTGLENSRAIVPIITQKYLGSRYCINELYSADGDQKLIFPIIFENVDFSASDSAKGVKFVISGINWTMCRPGVDDYSVSIEKLVDSMREKGLGIPNVPITTITKDVPLVTKEINPSKDQTSYPLRPVSTKPIKALMGFSNPNGVAVTHDNKLLVTDMGTNRVIVYDENFEKIGTIGSQGIGKGQFMCPQGVTVDADNNIYVTAYTMNCVQKFTVDGKFLGAAGTPGGDEGQFKAPNGIAVNENGNIYVCDLGNNRIQILSREMTHLGNFSVTDPEYGSGALNNPSSIAINSDGNIFVADMLSHCVQVFDPEGRYLARIGKQGHTGGCLVSPMAIAIDSDDLVYVADGVCRVSTFTKHGIFVRSFGSNGSELGKFGMPRGICIDKNERLYVCEWQNNRVQIFQ